MLDKIVHHVPTFGFLVEAPYLALSSRVEADYLYAADVRRERSALRRYSPWSAPAFGNVTWRQARTLTPSASESPAHDERKGDREHQGDDAHRDANPGQQRAHEGRTTPSEPSTIGNAADA